MAVLVECISVITRADSLLNKFTGGWEQFERMVPNGTLCADGEIARVGFMTPVDVEQFTKTLQESGLEYMRDGEAIDFTVADDEMQLLRRKGTLDVYLCVATGKEMFVGRTSKAK